MGPGTAGRVGAARAGGDEAIRKSRTGLTAGAAAALLTAALGTAPALGGGRYQPLLAVLGGMAMASMGAGLLVPAPAGVLGALGLLCLEYLLGLGFSGAALDGGAPLYGAGLLLAAEGARWSADGGPPPSERPVAAQRLLWVLGCGFGGAAVGAAAIATTTLPVSGGLWLLALGVLAAGGILAGLAWLAAPRPEP